MPPVLVDALARPGGQAQPADEVGAERHGGDELAAAHPAHVLAHGQGGGDGDHPRVHDGVLVDVVEVEGMGHGGVHLGGVRRRQLVAPAQDAALRGAAPLQHQVPHLAHSGLHGTAQSDPEEVEHLVLGRLHHFRRAGPCSGGPRKLATNNCVASGTLASIGWLSWRPFFAGAILERPDRPMITQRPESGKCRLTALEQRAEPVGSSPRPSRPSASPDLVGPLGRERADGNDDNRPPGAARASPGSRR